MVQTFVDTGVLIAGGRSTSGDRLRALEMLEDPSRVFHTSPFIYLECIPKAIFNKRASEQAFYERYFDNAIWYRDLAKIESLARSEAAKCGLGAMDALHLAAAHLSGAEEFVTTERPDRAIYRCSLVEVLYLFK